MAGCLPILITFFLIIFLIPRVSLFQIALRFLFGKKNNTGNPFGQQRGQQSQDNRTRTTWYTSARQRKKKIDSSEGEYIDFEDIKEKER